MAYMNTMRRGLAAGVFLFCTTVYAAPLRVTVSTTLIEAVAAAVGSEQVSLIPIIPHAMCPGHFDLSPRKAAEIASSSLFLLHGFESFARGLTFAGGGPRRVTLNVPGNGMIPSVHRELTTAVTTALCEAAPANIEYFRENAALYMRQVTAVEAATQSDRTALSGIPVLTAIMNEPFVEWTGCRVVGTFPRDEALSARVLGDLLRQGREEQVRMIVENQQSMGHTGRRLADELGIPLVVLSNFPALDDGGYPGALKTALMNLATAARK